MRITVIVFTLFVMCFSSQVRADSLDVVFAQRIEQIEWKLAELKANQHNYKIEKDLLKETYSSNQSSIQLIITIVLGLISVLGFLGLNSIWKTKKQYEKELAEFRSLKSDLETDYANFRKDQEDLDSRIEAINVLNQEQDVKLKILDIKEKAENYISRQAYIEALQYLAIGLELDPKSIPLLHYKALSNFKLQEYQKAIEIHEFVLEIEPNNVNSVFELAELYLFVGEHDKFEDHRREHPRELTPDLAKPRSLFFDALFSYLKGDESRINSIIDELLENVGNSQKKKHIPWDFSDVNKFLSDKDDSSAKTIFSAFIEIASGKMHKTRFEALYRS